VIVTIATFFALFGMHPTSSSISIQIGTGISFQ
jgi:hypothetical protein